jgi:hypothetical protein
MAPLPTLLSYLLVAVAAALLHLTRAGSVNRDPNIYQGGRSNPNMGGGMYFPDAASVLRNLDRFSSLSIRFHSCAWSPNKIASFDDDGTNYDGEEQWYLGRTAGSAANAGFSLYGTLKNRLLPSGGCHRATFINSFFTNNGADVLIDALGLNVDTSYSYCHEYEGDQEEGDNDASPASATLGCTLDGSFATALFTDDYCQGKYFWNISSTDGTYDSYNKKLRGVDCTKIWNGKTPRSYSNGGGYYESAAHQILSQSDVCDTRVNPSCPNPWSKKSREERAFGRTSGKVVRIVQRALVTFSNVLLAVGLVLTLVVYRARNKERLQKAGWWDCLKEDVPNYVRGGIRKRRRALRSKEDVPSPRRRKSRKKKKGVEVGNKNDNNEGVELT